MVGGVGRVDEVKRSVWEMAGVEWGCGVGPGDAFGGVGVGVGFELHAFETFDDVVGCSAAAVPDWPPSAVRFGQSGIGGWGG